MEIKKLGPLAAELSKVDLKNLTESEVSQIKTSFLEHCWNCQTRLIKNGEYWTYHSLMPMQPTNIKCPSCELSV